MADEPSDFHSSSSSTNDTQYSSSSLDFSEPFGSILFIQCMVAVALNLTVLTTFCKNRRLRFDGSSALLLNLVAADLGMTICGCPFSAIAAFSRTWPFGELGCILYGFQGMLFGLASIMSVAALQLDRYLIICHRSISSFSLCGGHRVFSTGVIWANACFWAAAPVFGWHRYDVESSGVSCAIDYQRASVSYVTWLAGVFLVCYVCPLVAMVYFEYSIRCQSSQITSTRAGQENANNQGFGNARTFLGLLTVFLVCWTPYAILCVAAVFFDVSSLPLTVAKLPHISAKMAAILNPVVYLTADGVRDALKRQFAHGTDKKEN